MTNEEFLSLQPGQVVRALGVTYVVKRRDGGVALLRTIRQRPNYFVEVHSDSSLVRHLVLWNLDRSTVQH